MAQDLPLMPKATAVWLVDETGLTFDQIAAFCGLHPLEVNSIADGDVGAGIRGRNPLLHGELTREEIKKGEDNSEYRLKISRRKTVVPQKSALARDTHLCLVARIAPNAILWLVKNHPELSDAQISRLVGTTKPTIVGIRDKSHWNFNNLQPVDPVSLGLTSQIDLDMAVQKAAKRMGITIAPVEEGPTLKPASETIAEHVPVADADVFADTPNKESEPEDDAPDAASVFAGFSSSADEEKDD